MPKITLTIDVVDADYAEMVIALGDITPESWLTQNCLSIVSQIKKSQDTKKLALVGITSLDSLTDAEKSALILTRSG